jgi:lysophospholipase L1-like esterase
MNKIVSLLNVRLLSYRLVALAATAACAAVASGGAQDFYLHDGDRVTFYGDSITAQRFYTQDIESFVDTRYPTLNVTFHNAGVPGDRVTGGYAGDAATRVARDVAPFTPTVLTVMLGMNEGGYTYFSPEVLPPFVSGYTQLLKLLRDAAPGARITLLENSPYDEVTHGTEFPGYMDNTERIAKSTIAIGQRENVHVLDTETPIKQLIGSATATEPKLAPLLIPDRIHPGEAAHWVTTAAIMKAWHVNPIVSAVDLDAPHAIAKSIQRTSVTALSGNSTGLKWQQQDQSLPLPLNLGDPLMQLILRLTDLASLDQEVLRVHGLLPSKYSLTIDQAKILGPFSSEELENGINLAIMETPMLAQARSLSGALDTRSKLEQAEFYLRVETSAIGKECASKALAEGEQDYTRQAHEAKTIKPHQFNLIQVEP